MSRGRVRGWAATAGRFLLGPWQPSLSSVFGALVVVQLFQVSAFILLDIPTVVPFARLLPLPDAASIVLIPFVTVLRAATATALIWLVLRIVQRATGHATLTRGSYLAFLLLAGMAVGIVRYWSFSLDPVVDPQRFASSLAGTTVIAFVLFGALGTLEERFARQARRADQATAVVSAQRMAVIRAEERARQSIAHLLHDRVQAGLVAVSLNLRQVQPEAPQHVAQRIGDVIEQLERLRARDVRSASRRLSPDFAVGGLARAIEDLGETYAPGMDVLVDDRTGDADWEGLALAPADAMLGAYRVVEQALLNAAVHGRAAHVVVRTEPLPGGGVALEVADDGAGTTDGTVAGTGDAVVASWAGMLGGAWGREPAQPGGTRLWLRAPRGTSAG